MLRCLAVWLLAWPTAGCTVNPVPTPSSESPNKGGGGPAGGEDDQSGEPGAGGGSGDLGQDGAGRAFDGGSRGYADAVSGDAAVPPAADATMTGDDAEPAG
jgi:hypothetical protein